MQGAVLGLTAYIFGCKTCYNLHGGNLMKGWKDVNVFRIATIGRNDMYVAARILLWKILKQNN